MVSETNFLKFAEECFKDIDCNTLDSFINETNSRAPLQNNLESAKPHYINSDPIMTQFVKSCGMREVIGKLGEKNMKNYRLTPSSRHNSVAIGNTKPKEEPEQLHQQNDSTAEKSRGKFASLVEVGMNLQSLGKSYLKRKCYFCYFHQSILHCYSFCILYKNMIK